MFVARECQLGHKIDRSINSRMSVLARVHHFETRKLGVGIHGTEGPHPIVPGAVQTSPPQNLAQHEPHRRGLSVLCSDNTPHPKDRNPARPVFFTCQKTSTNPPKFSPVIPKSPITVPHRQICRVGLVHRPIWTVSPRVDTPFIDECPPLPLIPASQVSCRPDHFPLPVRSPLGHPFALFGGESFARTRNHRDTV